MISLFIYLIIELTENQYEGIDLSKLLRLCALIISVAACSGETNGMTVGNLLKY